MMEKYNINQTTLKILGLYRSDYAKSLHLREIARAIEIDVTAVRLQLERLEGMNVLVSTFKGRNKEYRPNLGNQITRYYMILSETLASIIYLSENFEIKKVVGEIGDSVDGPIILFGSFAKGQATPESDIDLLVLANKEPPPNAFSEAGEAIGREISIRRMSKSQFLRGLQDGDPLAREIVSDHVVLRGFDDFCDVMWRYYAKRAGIS